MRLASLIYGVTECGKQHTENQDRILRRTIEWPGPMGNIYLWGVADGISTHSYGGSVARWLMERHLATEPIFEAQTGCLADQLRAHLTALHTQFKKEFDDFEDMLKSGATLSVAAVQSNYAQCFWAGDSPIFVNRADDAFAGEQISMPDITADRKLKDFFGGEAPFNLHHVQIRLDPGDIITIASDGANVDEHVLQEIYEQYGCSSFSLGNVVERALQSPRADDVSLVALVKM